ncbi:peptidase [Rhizocola hellebori]|uniref:Peptidase n=1 Tax=Rhizocola hellebori TaxID=1392758 RepID=A0A8J3Q7T5_9ACTN|nr:oxygenase MpaB family protein [Rhizocola hellebori]GIH05446.1 peptidase [Rhizocola hellebori]
MKQRHGEELVYRDLVLSQFRREARLGLQIAFYRTYAIPSIARLLLDTGELISRPVKRGYDTGIIMYELIYHGFEHPRGREIVSRLNRMHLIYEITNDEYRYVLGTLIFIPSRLIDRFGARKLTTAQRAATFHFYRRLGEHMNIDALPDTWEAYEAWFDRYERDHFAFDPAAKALIEASRKMATQRLPRPLRPVASAALDVLLDEPMRRALGLPTPAKAMTWLVTRALRLRARLARDRPPQAADLWWPGKANPAYPAGYTLDLIGPQTQAHIERR